MLGGPVELGGTIAEGNVYIDGNPVCKFSALLSSNSLFKSLCHSYVYRFVTTAGMQKMQQLHAGSA